MKFFHGQSKGAVALILVVMITALTVVSSMIISMNNVSEKVSSYYVSEANKVSMDMDACLDDALYRLASSTAVSGTYYLVTANTSCEYTIDSAIEAGLKTVTSTASTTSGLSHWKETIIAQINVSTTPVRVDSYKNSLEDFTSHLYCGDGDCWGNEDCANCSADCGVCQTCGNLITEGTEACDDGPEYCGDGDRQDGNYCNDTCTGYYFYSEVCDYEGPAYGDNCFENPVGCSKSIYCSSECDFCTNLCVGEGGP